MVKNKIVAEANEEIRKVCKEYLAEGTEEIFREIENKYPDIWIDRRSVEFPSIDWPEDFEDTFEFIMTVKLERPVSMEKEELEELRTRYLRAAQKGYARNIVDYVDAAAPYDREYFLEPSGGTSGTICTATTILTGFTVVSGVSVKRRTN